MLDRADITTYYGSPIGTLQISGTSSGISAVRFLDGDAPRGPSALPDALRACLDQLDEYFNGTRQAFSVPLDLRGTEFQRRVWDHLLTIPFGVTRSYLTVAEALGDRNAVRAVGLANGQNPVAIIVPCHRVIGSDGSLTGYGGGLWRKEWLLKHEGHPIQPRLI
jgi:methylated-DNA-[protein]-cysteine S-methyltransferase